MVTLNLDSLKLNFMNSIRTYLYPYQSSHSSYISLNANGSELVQTLYYFSDTISSCGVYVNSKVGNPDSLEVDLYNGTILIKTGTLASTLGWNTFSAGVSGIITSRQSSIVVRALTDVSNDWRIGCDTLSSYFHGSCGTVQLAFTIGVKNFVYPKFPVTQIDSNDFPVIAVDITGRPRIEDKYISGDWLWYFIRMRAEVWSNTTKEIDMLVSAMDRGINKIRDRFTNVTYITPGEISDLSYVKPDVYYRNITWTLRSLIAKE